MNSHQILYLARGHIFALIHLAHVGGRGAELDLGQARAGRLQVQRAHAEGGRRAAVLADILRQRTAAVVTISEHRMVVERGGWTLGHKNFRSRSLKPLFDYNVDFWVFS